MHPAAKIGLTIVVVAATVEVGTLVARAVKARRLVQQQTVNNQQALLAAQSNQQSPTVTVGATAATKFN